jgi:SPP1 family predicted phage head-tail adaptor
MRNQRITILKHVAGEDSVGQPLTALIEHRKAWANFRLLNGLQTLKADAAASVVKGSVRVGYCTDLAAGMVVDYLGARYKITAALPDLQHKRHVDLVVESIK